MIRERLRSSIGNRKASRKQPLKRPFYRQRSVEQLENRILLAANSFGESGFLSAAQPDDNTWHQAAFQQTYDSPVVVVGPSSLNGTDPTAVRVRNVTANGFEWQLQEWDYMNGVHGSETVGYMVVEAGSHSLAGGKRIVAGKIQTNHEFKTVGLPSLDTTPVILTSVSSTVGASTVTTRLRGVSGDSFEVRLQEEQGNDDRHSFETVSYIAIDTGSGEVFDATYIADNVNGVTHTGTDILFAPVFDSTPVLLASIQTFAGSDTVGLRYTSLDSAETNIFLEEEKSRDKEVKHGAETVGYLAIEPGIMISQNRSPVLLDQQISIDLNASGIVGTVSADDPDSDLLQYSIIGGNDGGHFSINNSGDIAVSDAATLSVGQWTLEIQVADPSLATAAAYLTIDIQPATTGAIGESGFLTASQPDRATWHQVTFQHAYDSPVVVLGPPSFHGTSPITTRVRNVSATGFQWQIKEWDYMDGIHGQETVGYLVLESGSHTLADGVQIVAGKVQANDEFASVDLQDFDKVPVVLTSVNSVRGAAPVATRLRGVKNDSFEVRVQEEEAKDQKHAYETVSYIAIETGTGQIGNSAFVSANANVSHVANDVLFPPAFQSQPVFLSSIQSSKGGDLAVVRHKSLDQAEARIFLEEEQSKDKERNHTSERVGYLAIEPGSLVGLGNAPSITSSNVASVPEGQIAVIDVEAFDPEGETENGGGLTFALTGNADDDLFEIDTNTGMLTFRGAPDFESPSDTGSDNIYNVNVTVTDSAGLSDTSTVSVSVSPVNENAPIFTSPTAVEIPADQTFVQTISASDADLPNQTITFSVSGGGADDSLFQIDANNNLEFINVPDFEAPLDANGDNVFEVGIIADDGSGLTTTQSISVTLLAPPVPNDAPTITTGPNISVPENQLAVIDINAFDPDGETENGGGLSYSITGNLDDSLFAIDPNTGDLAFNEAPDYEAPADVGSNNIYDVQVTVTDSFGLTGTINLTVSATPVNDHVPIFAGATSVNVPSDNTFVTSLLATDEDSPSQYVAYSITGNGADDSFFHIVGENRLEFISAPDFAAPLDADSDNTYEVEVMSDDGNGLTSTKTINVSIAESTSGNAVVEFDFNEAWSGNFDSAGFWNTSGSLPGTVGYKTQTGGGLFTRDGNLVAQYVAPRAQSPAQSLIIEFDEPMSELWVQMRFRLRDWQWGNSNTDTSPWYTKLYRLWDLDDQNPQYTEKEAIHYSVFGFSSSRTGDVMHPYYNVVANSVPGPDPKASSGGPSMAFRHYPYPVEAGSTPPISSGFPEAIFGAINPDGTIPNEDAWIDILTHYRSATPGNDDGIVEHWVNNVAIDPSEPGTPEIKYNYGSPTDRVNFPSEGAFDHVVLLDNTGALYGDNAEGAEIEVDRFAIFAADPRFIG